MNEVTVEQVSVKEVSNGYQMGLRFRSTDPEWRNAFFKSKSDMPDISEGDRLELGKDIVFYEKENDKGGKWYNWREPSEKDKMKQEINKLRQRQSKIVKAIKSLRSGQKIIKDEIDI